MLLGIRDIRSALVLKFYPKPVAQCSNACCLLSDLIVIGSNHCQHCLIVKVYKVRALLWSESSTKGESCQQCTLKLYFHVSCVPSISTYAAIPH